MYGKRDTVQLLLEQGADVDARDHYGKTALHYAAYKGEIETIALLVERGASTSVRDKGGKLPLDHLLERELSVVLSSVLSSVRSNAVEGQRLWRQLMEPSCETDKVTVIRRCLELWRRQSDDATELTEIPFEVVKEGAASVEMYISALTVSGSTTYRHKICVVGPMTTGKTSLIKSLTRGESTLESIDTRTVGIDLFSHRFESRDGLHEVTFWDFAGQDLYHAAHAVFFTRRTLFLLVVDLAKYAAALPDENERQQNAEPRIKRFVDEHVLHWLRLILTRLPDATIAVVGTKTDLVVAEVVDDIRMDLEQRIACWCEEQSALQKTPEPEQDPTPTATMKHQPWVLWLDMRESLTNAVQGWLTVSSADNLSIQQTRTRLEHLIVAQGRGFLMPDTYSSVLERVQRRRGAPGDSLPAQVKRMFVRKQELLDLLVNELPTLRPSSCKLVMRTLHELGDVLWYDASQVAGALKEQACLAPDLVINLVREIVSHELFELMQGGANDAASSGDHDDDAPALTIRQEAYNSIRDDVRFAAWQQQLLCSGCVDGTLIKMLPLWRDIAETEALAALKSLLQHLGLAYPVRNGDNDEVMHAHSSLIVPAYWKMREAVNNDTRDLDLVTHLRLSTTRSALLHEYAWEYEFYASFFPPTLFETVIVSSFTPSAERVVTTPECVVAVVRDEGVVQLEILGGMHRKRLLRVEAVAVTEELAQRLVLYHCGAVEAALAEYRGLNPIVQRVRREDSQTDEVGDELRQRLLQDAIARFPRLCDLDERPKTLLLQIQVVDLSWNDATIFTSSFCCRDREIPSPDMLKTEWSLQTIDGKTCWKAMHECRGQDVIHIRDVPAVSVLKQCVLRVVVKRCRRFLSHAVLASSSLRLGCVIPDESLGVFEVKDVKMRLTGDDSHTTAVVGQLRCKIACIANQKEAVAA
ncbi:hypothetical protein PINS_up009305 [Pythium insidiosum]|nr:hypothetical protein PINS_up009305 [Pythium insidiosum]